MITIRAFRSAVPLALAVVVGLIGAAAAQESPPAKKSKPAAKSTKSESAKSENGEAKPAAKARPAGRKAKHKQRPEKLELEDEY